MTLLSPGDPATLADVARTGLRDVLDASAAVVGRAPGRVNLIGEHTDYNGGLVLPIALPHATYAAAAPRSDGRVRIASAQEEGVFEAELAGLAPGTVEGWAAYTAGVVWALGEAGIEVPGLDLYVDGTVPLGAGLSSSASVECAVAAAVVGLADHTLDHRLRARIADACIRAETEVAEAPTGGMDQTVSVFGEAGSALLIDFTSGDHRAVPLALGDRAVLVTDTRVSHQLTDGGYGSRRTQCEQAAKALGVPSLRQTTLAAVEALADGVVRRRARHVVTEIARVEPVVAALGAADWEAIATLFAASHASMRDDFEISTPELDLVVDTVLASGADGARMTGGGFGGSVVTVLPTAAVEEVTDAVDKAFASAGHAPPAHLLAVPSEGMAIIG